MNFLINSALTLASNQLKYFSRLNNFWQVFDTAFGTQYNRSVAEILRLQWETGDFSQLPQIEVLDSSILGGANGAYASSTNKIYLSNTFVAGASLAAISRVLLEEIGHFVDAKINQTDSAGDEGAIFAALVQGQSLDVETLKVLKAEDDHSIITLNNRQIDIEQANTTVSLPGVSGSSVAWADYNGDGKQDFLLTGSTSSQYVSAVNISKLYKNTGNGFTEDTTVSLPGVYQGSVTWADYNGDGKQDLLLTGSISSGGRISKLYKNTGNGFTEDTTVSLPSVSSGSVTWADYNGDGKQDLLLTGFSTGLGYISKLYKNTGNGFTEDTTVSLPGVSGSVAWADYNGDGKQDFLLTGFSTGLGYISKLYKNTGNGFTEDITVSLPGVGVGSVAWADYNGDGKQDFLLTGSSDSGYISKLYKNTGNGFTEDTTVSLPGVDDGSVAWADYNDDGKQDFLLTGVTYISKLYKNTGNGFTEDTTVSLPGVSYGSVAWADYNGDGKQDFLLTGVSSASSRYLPTTGYISKLYKNTGNGFTEDTTVSLPGVYQGSVTWADYNGDGKQDFLLTGYNTGSRYISKLYKNTGNGFTEDTTVSLPGVDNGSVAWADYNGDGKQDFLLTGSSSSDRISKLYKNTGNGFTEDTTVSLPGVSGSVAWADYNGDGKQDFLLTGFSTGLGYISKLYKNTGNGFTEDITVSLPGVSYSSVAWADYNGDGKQDLLLTGYTDSVGGWIVKLYKNTGNGFTEDITVSLPSVSFGSVDWADYNSDGKQDLLLTGYNTGLGYISKLYKNTGNGFTEDTTVSLPGVDDGSVAWADYNGDGKQDLLLTGVTYISKLYKNTGNGFEEDINANKSDTNQAPTNITLNNSTIAENQPINTKIGNFTTIDPNTGDTFTYSLVSGTGDTDNDSFIIVGNNELQTKAVFDYETKNSYSIRVKTTDRGGLSFEKQLTIGVTDINETVANLSISPSNVTQTEGNLGNKPFTFTVTRTGDTTGTNSVNWSVNSPASFDDFANTTGTITFAPGEISKDIIVNVKGDLTQENNETFTVNLLSFNNNATITTATATGTITNDDLALATIQLPFPIKLITKLSPLLVGNLQIVGNYAYVATGSDGLEIIDISDPTNPIIKGRWNYNITSGLVTSGSVYSVQVIGNYAYAASSRGLEIIDISNPTAPTLKGNYISNLVQAVEVVDNYAYVANYQKLEIIDISDPSNPKFKGSYPSGYARDVQVIGNYVYVANDKGLEIIDISDPSNPKSKGSYASGNISNASSVQVVGNYAYLVGVFSSLKGWELQIINISNPSNPTLQASYATNVGSYVEGGVVGNYAYVFGDSGLEIIDISNPSNPTLKGYYNSGNMQVVGNYAYVAGTFGLQIIDITDITKAIPKGNYDTGNYAQSVQVVDNYAYVSASDAGLQIIDITDPTKPILKGNYDTPGYAHNVQLLGNYAYVADGLSGLQIIDISNATTPTLKGNYDTLGYAHDVQLLGNYAYVADGLSGLQIIDISDPSVPSLKENYNTPGDANDVQVVGNYAYVADGRSGLQIIDISDPTKPILKGNYKSTYQTYADNVRVVGNYAYLLDNVDYGSGIEIIDISDPSKPTLKSKDDLSYGYDVQVIGNYAYVVDDREIKVIDVGDFTDTNQAPTNITLNNSTIAENQPINTKIGNFTTTDPNTANAFTYSLVSGTGDTDNDSFIIVGNNELQTKAVFDYETKNSYSVRVKTTDQGGLSFEKQLTIGVTDVNETPTNQAPTNITLNNSTIAENQAINTVVGNFTTTDPDEGNTFTYTLVSGTGDTDNNVFTITNNELKTNSGFDYETKNSYSIRIKTTDQGGLSFEKQLTIGVTDVNEVPVITSPTTANFAENGTGTVYTVIATDVDAGTPLYSLSGTDASLFNISNGNVNFKNAPNFELPSDSGGNNVYDINVIASDGSLTATQAVAITVTNVNEVPSNLTLSNSTIAENQAINTVVGNFTTIDPDEGNTFTYTLVSGTGDTDNNVFTITNNELKTNSGFDYETKNSYSIRIKTTDQGGLSFEKQLTIGVTDVNEPVANLSISPSNVTQTEGNSGTKAFTFTVTRSEDTSGSSSANWAVTGSGTDQADVTDFGGTLPTGTVGFAAGETTKTIIVDVLGDTTVEPDEGFTVTLSNPTNATITTATAVGTITNDDRTLTPITDYAPNVNISTGLIFSTNGGGNLSLDTNRLSASNEVTGVQNGTKSNFNHLFGLYEVVDAEGGINTEKGVLKPGDSDYAFYALTTARVKDFIVQAGSSDTPSTATQLGSGVSLQGNKFYAPFVIANCGTYFPNLQQGVEDFVAAENGDINRFANAPQYVRDLVATEAGNEFNNAPRFLQEPVAYFSFGSANPDKSPHLRSYGNGVYGFEDLPATATQYSNNDFNDAVFALS